MTFEEWIDATLPMQSRVTAAVVNIIENLLKTNGIDYLAVSGRTKDKQSTISKVKRKSYTDPKNELTDLSGIRVIVYFESDIRRVSDIITNCFNVDFNNSLNQDERLSVDQIGYRSVHYVCDLGPTRSALPEFEGLSSLKFEIQVRTVLQHAWAELAHDRSYKFSGKLPAEIERHLFLYAGMLEIADKGFDELSLKIDEYTKEINSKSQIRDFNYQLDSISLPAFVKAWADANDIGLENLGKTEYDDLLHELHLMDVHTAKELEQHIPPGYVKKAKELSYTSTVYGFVRDWLIISDWRKYFDHVDINYVMDGTQLIDVILQENPTEWEEYLAKFGPHYIARYEDTPWERDD